MNLSSNFFLFPNYWLIVLNVFKIIVINFYNQKFYTLHISCVDAGYSIARHIPNLLEDKKILLLFIDSTHNENIFLEKNIHIHDDLFKVLYNDFWCLKDFRKH